MVVVGVPVRDTLHVVEDRRAALAYAVRAADPRDVILVAGKGHEDYQVIGTSRQPYSDLAQVRTALSERGRR